MAAPGPSATGLPPGIPTTCMDDQFGPWAGPYCRSGFDFTLLFEETILTIPIQALLLYIVPIRFMQLLREDRKTKANWHATAKMVASAFYLAINAALLGVWTTVDKSAPYHTPASVPTAALMVGAAGFLCVLSYMEHRRTLRPSFVITVYLLLSLLCDMARVRTTWMLDAKNPIPALTLVSYIARIIMLIVESHEKRSILIKDNNYSPEMLAGTINRALFYWLMPLFKIGYKRNFIMEDLYLVDEKMRAEAVHKMLTDEWAKVEDKQKKGAFMWAWVRAFAGPLAAPAVPRLFVTGFTFAQPYLIEKAVLLAALPEQQPFDNWGYGLMGAFALVYGGMAIAAGQYAWYVRRFGARIRGSLNGMVFEKSLKLDISSPSVSPVAGITLIGNDAETIVQGLLQFHDIWASVVEISIAIYLVYVKLGAACAVPIALGLLAIVATFSIAIPTGRAQAMWIGASQDRVSATSKTLGNVKWLKVSGLTEMAFSVMRRLRDRELAISMRYRMLLSFSMLLMVLVPIWSPILTFATWAGVSKNNHTGLGLGGVFASYSLIGVMNGPLGTVITAMPTVAGAITSFQRVQNHMNGAERKDNRANGTAAGPPGKEFLPQLSDDSFSETVYGSESFEMYEVQRHSMLPKAALENDVLASVDGKFSWKAEDEKPVLDIRGLNIKRGDLTFLIGPVGSGKSTLLKAFLGELNAFEGRIRTDFRDLAYCDQTPWVPNLTVRAIIMGPLEYDERWYRQVIRACALEEDIFNWPEGDRTVAGSGGLTMSGGQKQRLSLARAIYAKREFVIFDDVFAGLDSTTENWVFHSLLGRDGLMRKAGMTVLCATSQVNRLRYGDKLVFLTESGEIKEMGHPKELEHALGESVSAARWDVELKADELPMPEGPDKDAQQDILDAMEEAQADTSRRLGDSAMYMFYARAAGRTTLLILAIAMACYAFCMAFPTVWLGKWQSAEDPLDNLGKWLGVYVALGVGAVLSIGTGTYQILIRIIDRAGKYFHNNMTDTVSRAPMSFFGVTDSGVTLNRFSQDLRLIDFELPGASFGVATALSAAVAQFVMVSIASKYMAAFLPVLVLILYFVQAFYLRTSRQMRLLDIENKSPLYTQLVEMLNGLPTIRAYQWQEWVHKKNYLLVDNSQRPAYLLACLQCWLNMVTDIFIMIIAMVFIVLTTTLRSQIGAQNMGVGLSNILGFSNTIKTFVTFWVMLEIALGAVSRVNTFCNETDYEGSQDGELKEPPADVQWPSEGEIRLNNIVASYPTSGPILKNVSLVMRPGEKIAICGRTGSGKSSLTLCLLRLMDLDEGNITIDGYDLKTLPHEYIRHKLVALPQSAYIFDGTVRLNLDPTKEVADEEIEEVLKRVQLWPKVESRGGLDTIVGDSFFSPGEAQLLVFARAMLRKSRVLILDEFTSSLDETTSVIVEKLMREWFQGYTVITIAHKLDAITDFDKVAVMEAGKLIEYDSPNALLADENSSFRSLYNSFSDAH